jgi:glycosyltransferase involved in cell wall biosynthesis
LPRRLFLGFVYPPEMQDYVMRHERGSPQIAANKLGWFFIRGMESAMGEAMDVLSVLAVSRYPVFSRLFIRPSARRRDNGAELWFVPFLNVPFFKRFFIALATIFYLLRWLWRTRGSSERVVAVYAMYSPTLLPAALVCRLSGVPLVLFVPDLPEFMDPGSDPPHLLRWLRNVNARLSYWCAERASGFVFLTRHMADRFCLAGRPFAVVEGCVDAAIAAQAETPAQDPSLRVAMYAGILASSYGVRTLVQAFTKLRAPNYRLWLCGRGEMESEIRQLAAADPRIEYLGVLPNAEVLQRERQATVLVNARPSCAEFTKYSFPSKNLEYLSSGRPVILCRLPGIPDEYFDYCYALDDESIPGMTKLLQKVLSERPEELTALGRRARDFVRENKNYVRQGEKVHHLIETVLRRHVSPTPHLATATAVTSRQGSQHNHSLAIRTPKGAEQCSATKPS